MIAYFKDMLSTLKRIEKHLQRIASTVSDGGGRANPSLRTGKNQWEF